MQKINFSARFFPMYLLLNFVFAISAQASSVGLKELISEALQQSPQVQRSKAVVDEADWKKKENLQAFLPTLNGSINYLTQKKYMLVDIDLGAAPATIAQVIPTTQYSLTATLPLFDGMASFHRLDAAESQRSSARSDFEWVKFSTEKQVTLSFYKSLAAQALKDVSEQNLKTINDHLKDVQEFKRAGISTNYDVLRVEVQVSEAKSEVLNAKDNYELSKYRLGEILGKEVEDRELAGQLPNLSNQNLSGLKTQSSEARKDLVALREKVQATESLATAASRYWSPRISAFAQYQYYNNINDRFDDSEAFREAYQIGLNLNWNFFDGMSSIAKSHEAAAQRIQLENSLRTSELKAKQDIEFWKRKFNYFNTVYLSKVADLEKSNETIRLAKEGRRQGVRTTTDLLDAELDLFRSRAGLVTAQIGAIEALISLELATGQHLYDFN